MKLKPDETMYGSSIPTAPIINAIKQEIIIPMNREVVRNISCGGVKVFTIEEEIDEVPLFTQFVSFKNKGNELLFVDTRRYRRAPTDELITVLYGKIGSLWVDGQSDVVKHNTKLAGKAWVSLVSMSIGKSYSLDMQSKMDISLILALYYESMFNNKDGVVDYKVRSSMANYVSTSSNNINAICDKYDNYLGEIEDLVNAIANSGPVSLNRFNVPTLVSLTSRFYYGANAQLNLAIANEYIPRWTSIVGSALQSMSHGRTPLGDTVKKLSKNDTQMAAWLQSLSTE